MAFRDWFKRRQSHPELRFEGSDGASIEKAVIVRGATYDLMGTAAEFFWLEREYGSKDVDWKLLTHSHGSFGGREIDTIEIEVKSGERTRVYFDITESFGKWPDME